jgi:hypothetical protein
LAVEEEVEEHPAEMEVGNLEEYIGQHLPESYCNHDYMLSAF